MIFKKDIIKCPNQLISYILFVFVKNFLLSSFSPGRQHYRLYTIKNISSLKILDFTKITKTERERAERLANSAAGAALETDVQEEGRQAKTFEPGEGMSLQENFVTNFTKEQKDQIRLLVANAKSPAEIEEIERSVKRGILPAMNGSNSNNNKRPPNDLKNGGPTKKARQESG